jgi:hypothetical protein
MPRARTLLYVAGGAVAALLALDAAADRPAPQRAPYLPPFTIHDDAEVHVIAYCSAIDREPLDSVGREPADLGCPATVDPPWRPTYFRRGSGRIHFDPDATRARRRLDAACCYWAQWGEAAPRTTPDPAIWEQRE